MATPPPTPTPKIDHAAQLRTVAKLVEQIRESQAKTYELTEELMRVVAGDRRDAEALKRLELLFGQEFKNRYHVPYAFQYMKDRPHIKRLLKLTTEPDIAARIRAYFHDADPYLRNARHPFGLFVSRFNTLVPLVAEDAFGMTATQRVTGCTHIPACANDVEHTRRRSADVKAGTL